MARSVSLTFWSSGSQTASPCSRRTWSSHSSAAANQWARAVFWASYTWLRVVPNLIAIAFSPDSRPGLVRCGLPGLTDWARLGWRGRRRPARRGGVIDSQPGIALQCGDLPPQPGEPLRQFDFEETDQPVRRPVIHLVDHLRQAADPRPHPHHLVLGVFEPGPGAAQVPFLHRRVRLAAVEARKLPGRELRLRLYHFLLAVADGLLPQRQLFREPFEPAANFELHAGHRFGQPVAVIGERGVPVAQCIDGSNVGSHETPCLAATHRGALPVAPGLRHRCAKYSSMRSALRSKY